MTIQQVASAIAKREGKRSQTHIGNIREILKVIATIDGEMLFAGNHKGPIFALTEYANKICDKLNKKRGKKNDIGSKGKSKKRT